LAEKAQKKFYNLYLLDCENIAKKRLAIFNKIDGKMIEIRAMTATLKSNLKKDMVAFF
jgi:hypothetical protein